MATRPPPQSRGRANASPRALVPGVERAISKVFTAADLNQDDNLGAGLFDFDRFEDASWFLAGIGWLHRPANLVEFCRGCGSIEITRPQLADDVRRLYAEVVEALAGDPEQNKQRYVDELARTDARMAAGKKIITYATILRQALEHGWAGREQNPVVWKHTAAAAALKAAKGTR